MQYKSCTMTSSTATEESPRESKKSPSSTSYLSTTTEKLRLFYKFCKLGLKIRDEDKEWVYDEEPHVARRKAILRAHPEIKQLMGPDPLIAVIVVGEVLLQLLLCYLLQDASWPVIVAMSYFVGGSINHSLGASIHEIGHNLAFGHKRAKWNRYLGIFANLPIGIPMSVTYKKYHTDHHRYLGHETLDVDIPSRIEVAMFDHGLLRAVWLFLYPLMQTLRLNYKSPMAVTTYEIYNFIVQIAFDLCIYYTFGLKILFYLVGGSLLSFGIHPLGGHFISEHYLFRERHHATYSYYGPLNPILFNVGYHVEHHDFPYIPCTRISKVREIAPEFYKHLPHHTSWVKVIWDFIFDPAMGLQSHGLGYVYNYDQLESHATNEMKKLPADVVQEGEVSAVKQNGITSKRHGHMNGDVRNGNAPNGVTANGEVHKRHKENGQAH